LPAQFDFQQFQAMTPLDGVNIWAYLLDRHADRITVKRRKPALENLEKSSTPRSSWPTRSASAP
jgi:hypothetical protein